MGGATPAKGVVPFHCCFLGSCICGPLSVLSWQSGHVRSAVVGRQDDEEAVGAARGAQRRPQRGLVLSDDDDE